MPFQMKLWQVNGSRLVEVGRSKLDAEARLEEWIAADPRVVGLDLLIIGRQVPTDYGGWIDLLALDAEGNLVILELKRNRTPREVVAQVLDYASWVKDLPELRVEQIAAGYLKKPLSAAFLEKFGGEQMPEINIAHHMVIIASSLDSVSERIVQYLVTQYGVNINAVFFNFYRSGDQELLGRAWLMDPDTVEKQSVSSKRPPWSGYYFVNVGESDHRNWDDNRRYGFISAGQGPEYSRPLQKLKPSDKIFAYLKGNGYVGYGEVTQPAVKIDKFIVTQEGKPLLDLALKAPRPRDNIDDPEKAEYVVGVNWLKTFPREEARTFIGVFANPNIVCRLRHEETVQFVKREFGVSDEEPR